MTCGETRSAASTALLGDAIRDAVASVSVPVRPADDAPARVCAKRIDYALNWRERVIRAIPTHHQMLLTDRSAARTSP